MPIPSKSLTLELFFERTRSILPRFLSWCGKKAYLLVFLLLCAAQSHALVEGEPVHFSGDKQIWNRKENHVELFGHAAVTQPAETLTADYIYLDLNTRTLDAIGNAVYLASDSVIWGEEMHFNLETRAGIVKFGRVSNDKFTLRGEEIHKLGNGRFRIQGGEYTTCHDCAASWSLFGQHVDLEIDGYAKLSDVTVKIKGAPAFWLPYLVVPIKTRRQTGLLFPKLNFGGFNGTEITLPFFWAINRSADMTFGFGDYTKRGYRGEWEGRYALTPRSGGKANAFYVFDQTGFGRNRWGITAGQTHEFPADIIEKIKLSEVSDNLDPFHFSRDFPLSAGEAFLSSSLSFSRATPNLSSFISFNRYRNLLNSAPGDALAQQNDFDERTVQAIPSIFVTTNDHVLENLPMIGGLSVGLTRFTRGAGPFDYDASGVPFGTVPPPNVRPYLPGVDPLREATRFSITPSFYTTLRPFEVFSVVPSVQYRGYLYNFSGFVPTLYREYLLFQTDLSMQLERLFDFPETPLIPRAKHLIRPLLTYSYIPFNQESDPNHPFLQQIQYAQNNSLSGYYFDSNDIVPVNSTKNTSNYFYPLGNSLAYGLTSQWIRRRGALEVDYPTYQTTVELTAGQALNFKELREPLDPVHPRPLSRFFSILNLNFDHLSSQTVYYYYADDFSSPSRHAITSSVSWVLERGYHERVLLFDRSVTLGYTYNKILPQNTSNVTTAINFSLNDYILPSFNLAFDLVTNRLLLASAGVQIQSLSRCWKLGSMITYRSGFPGIQWSAVDISLNLTGTGFGGITEIANPAIANPTTPQ